MGPDPEHVSILGSRIQIVQIPAVMDRVEGRIREPESQCRQVVVTGFHGIWEAHRNPELRAILNSADLWVPDGIAPVWVARLRGHRGVRRIPGADLMRAFFERANEKGYRSFFCIYAISF